MAGPGSAVVDAEVPPDERLDPNHQQDDGHDGDERDRPQSNWPASATWSYVQPHQVRLANGARSGTGAAVAVEDEPGEGDDAGDARRRPATEERRQGEREGAAGEGQEPSQTA